MKKNKIKFLFLIFSVVTRTNQTLAGDFTLEQLSGFVYKSFVSLCFSYLEAASIKCKNAVKTNYKCAPLYSVFEVPALLQVTQLDTLCYLWTQ